METQWAVQDSCFNCCLDDLVINDQLEEEIAAGVQKYSATTLLIMRILLPCKNNTPFSISEIDEIENPLKDYLQNISLKQEVFKKRSDPKMTQLKSLISIKNSSTSASQADYVNHEILALLLQLDNSEVGDLLSEKEDVQRVIEILENVFNNEKLSYYDEIIRNIQADNVFDCGFSPKAPLKVQEFAESSTCQICQRENQLR